MSFHTFLYSFPFYNIKLIVAYQSPVPGFRSMVPLLTPSGYRKGGASQSTWIWKSPGAEAVTLSPADTGHRNSDVVRSFLYVHVATLYTSGKGRCAFDHAQSELERHISQLCYIVLSNKYVLTCYIFKGLKFKTLFFCLFFNLSVSV